MNARLILSSAYNDWNKPIDRVDKAAYHHNLAYQHFPDTAHRNIADRAMLREMDTIKKFTAWEKAEWAIIKPIINMKQKFGLGF